MVFLVWSVDSIAKSLKRIAESLEQNNAILAKQVVASPLDSIQSDSIQSDLAKENESEEVSH